jgi:hypothetical protein
MGLKFHEPFDMQQLAQAKPEIAPVEWQAPVYVNQAGDVSSWNDGWNRMSLDELRDQLDGFLKH